jgi:hypothetical protein
MSALTILATLCVQWQRAAGQRFRLVSQRNSSAVESRW